MNPSNFNRKSTMMFKLVLKKYLLAAYRTLGLNGLIQKVSIFCVENEHFHAFYAPTRIIQIGWGHHVNFCVREKPAITFGEGCMWWIEMWKSMTFTYDCQVLQDHMMTQVLNYLNFKCSKTIRVAEKPQLTHAHTKYASKSTVLATIDVWRTLKTTYTCTYI